MWHIWLKNIIIPYPYITLEKLNLGTAEHWDSCSKILELLLCYAQILNSYCTELTECYELCFYACYSNFCSARPTTANSNSRSFLWKIARGNIPVKAFDASDWGRGFVTYCANVAGGKSLRYRRCTLTLLFTSGEATLGQWMICGHLYEGATKGNKLHSTAIFQTFGPNVALSPLTSLIHRNFGKFKFPSPRRWSIGCRAVDWSA